MNRTLTAIILVFAIFAFSPAKGQETVYVGQQQELGLSLQASNFFELSGEHHISSFILTEEYTEEGLFTRINIEGNTRTDVYGHPEMPAVRKLIRVPLGANASVNILDISYEDIDLAQKGYPAPVYPAQPPRSKSDDYHEFIIDRDAYSRAGFEKHDLLSIDMLGILRDKRIARINFVPFAYDPVRHILRVYHQITFRIDYKDADIPATLALEERLASPAFRSINKSLANRLPAGDGKDNFKLYPVKYVIIADRMFESQLQPFIEWKTKKGFMVVESYTDEGAVGNSLVSIKSYIQGLYDAGTPEDPAPSYVLFVGDVQQVPTWDDGNGATDKNYCEFTGDLFPEIYYGRFSAQNTDQLQPYIDKTLQYEKYQMPDPAYLDEVVMVAGMDGSHGYDWGNGQINYGTINYFNEDHGITSHTYLYPNSGPNAAQIRQDISDGVTFGNYTAHCSPNGWADPSFVISDIPALENQDMYCVLVGNCCSSSEYQLNECFAEAIVRTADKGAVGYIGASNSTYWDEDYYFGVGVGQISQNPPPYSQTTLGYYDRAFHDHGEPFLDWYVSGHEMIFAGNLAVTEGSPGRADYYWDIYNYMGDPSLMVFFSNPPVTAVSYTPLLPLQSTSFSVTTEPYAYVALTLDGDYIGAALADETGLAVIGFPPLTVAGNADVVVTRQNGQPFMGTVLISSPSGAYLMLDDVDISDPEGNNNGNADYGESIALDVSLENVGNGDAENATTNLLGSDPYVTVNKDTHPWPTIPGQSILMEEDVFELDIASDVPDQHTVLFEIEIETPAKETWVYEYELILNAPVLTIKSMLIDDSQTGNDNGRLDPGETATIKIENYNMGHSIAKNTEAMLTSDCQYIEFDNNSYSLGDLGMIGYEYAEFVVSVDPDAPDGAAFAEFDYTLSAGEYSSGKQFRKKIGLIMEDFETGDFTRFEWNMDGEGDWETTDYQPYDGSYSAISGEISDGESSILTINVDVMIADTVFFIYKTSSQLGNDMLKFYVNNSLKGEWSGVGQGWRRAAFYVPAGMHTLKWIYQKDGSGLSGDDCVWLDNIIFPPLMTLTCYAGPDDYTCDGSEYECQGEATDWISVMWSTSGDGSFSDPSVLQPIYTPGSNDIANGSVELTIMAEDTEGGTVDDEMTLMLLEIPDAPDQPSGPDQVNVANTPDSEYTTQAVPYAEYYEWQVEPAGAGSFSGMDTTGTISWNASFSGEATITVRAANGCGEGIYSEGLIVTVDNMTGITDPSAGPEFAVYPNPSKGSFIIEASHGINNAEISVHNIIGKVVYRRSLDINKEETLQLGLQGQPKGLYILSIRSNDFSYNKKIIIK